MGFCRVSAGVPSGFRCGFPWSMRLRILLMHLRNEFSHFGHAPSHFASHSSHFASH